MAVGANNNPAAVWNIANVFKFDEPIASYLRIFRNDGRIERAKKSSLGQRPSSV
jgi:hypothetical protein